MLSFGPECQHIIAGSEYNPQEIVLHSTSRIQHDLNLLDGGVFPLPFCEKEAKVPLESCKSFLSEVFFFFFFCVCFVTVKMIDVLPSGRS
jgi:hypothetical protein